MPSISGPTSINPPESPAPSPHRVARVTVVVHEFARCEQPAPPAPNRPGGARQPTGGRHHEETNRWLDLAERTLHSWPIPLRLAVLTLVLATGTAAVAAVVGMAGQLALAVLGLRAHRRHRKRLRALRAPLETARRARVA